MRDHVTNLYNDYNCKGVRYKRRETLRVPLIISRIFASRLFVNFRELMSKKFFADMELYKDKNSRNVVK